MHELEEPLIADPAGVAACWEANAETWTRHARAGYDIYRDALNTPAFLSILPRARVAPFRTPRFDRTLSAWVEMVCQAGLAIEQFAEPCASRELAEAEPVVADTRVAPLFLHIRAR